MANTLCYYLRNIEHVPLISGSFKKSNRKTEPNLPKRLCAAVPRDVLISSPRVPLWSRVPALEHVGLLLGSAGMLRPQAKCDSAQGKALTLDFCLVIRGGSSSHWEFGFKQSQILSLQCISCARGDLCSIKNVFFLFGPYPLAASQLSLICFALPAKNTPSKSIVWFALSWWVELVQSSTKGNSGLRNVPFWSPWINESIWCLWGWNCVDSMLQWLNFTSTGIFYWIFPYRCLKRTSPTIPTPVAGTSLSSWSWSTGSWMA